MGRRRDSCRLHSAGPVVLPRAFLLVARGEWGVLGDGALVIVCWGPIGWLLLGVKVSFSYNNYNNVCTFESGRVQVHKRVGG